MRFLLLVIMFLCFNVPVNAQSRTLIVEEIGLASSKRNVEEFVVHKVRDYFDANIGNSWKTIKKKRGVNLSKKSKRQSFLNELEDELRSEFNKVDAISKIDLYKKYGVFITHILGRHARVHVFTSANPKYGTANLDVGFTNEQVQYITYDIQVVAEYYQWSGYAYNTQKVNELINIFSTLSMGFKHQSSRWSTNVCSEKGEPQYIETFTAQKSGAWSESYRYSFGPYVKQYNKYSCGYTGNNHLTAIEVYLGNEKIKTR